MQLRSVSRPGFTMVEIILVVVIVGVVMAIGLPRVDALRFRADAGVVQVRSLMMQAQREAVVKQHDLLVSIDTARHRLILGYDRNNDGNVVGTERIRVQQLPENAVFASPPVPLEEPSLPGLGAIRAVKVITVSDMPTVVFRRDGSVSTPLQVYTTVRKGRMQDFRVTTVDQATGRTGFQRYNGSSWRRPS